MKLYSCQMQEILKQPTKKTQLGALYIMQLVECIIFRTVLLVVDGLISHNGTLKVNITLLECKQPLKHKRRLKNLIELELCQKAAFVLLLWLQAIDISTRMNIIKLGGQV